MLNHIWLSFSATNIVFQNVWFVAAIWMALALIASLVSIRTGISVALIEIFIGVVAGNFLHLTASNEWINFLAMLGSGVLTFLAGAEIDPVSLKANWRASVLIGVLSFAIPFAIVWVFAEFVLGWPLHQAQIAGIALSTTSVAVVYAVMIEGGFSDTAMGKMILAACFITDFGTRAGARYLVRRLQSLAAAICDRDVDRSVVHATVDAIDHHTLGRDAGERTRGKVHPLRSLLSRRPRYNSQKRSRLASLSPWSCGRRCISSRQNPCSSHA